MNFLPHIIRYPSCLETLLSLSFLHELHAQCIVSKAYAITDQTAVVCQQLNLFLCLQKFHCHLFLQRLLKFGEKKTVSQQQILPLLLFISLDTNSYLMVTVSAHEFPRTFHRAIEKAKQLMLLLQRNGIAFNFMNSFNLKIMTIFIRERNVQKTKIQPSVPLWKLSRKI